MKGESVSVKGDTPSLSPIGGEGVMKGVETFATLAKAWPKVVGAQIAAICRPVAFNMMTGTLHVRVSTSAWAEELGRLGNDVLASLPASLDGIALRRIAWKRP